MKTISSEDRQDSHVSNRATSVPADKAPGRVPTGEPAGAADPPPHADAPVTPKVGSLNAAVPQPPVSKPPASAACASLPKVAAAGRNRGRAGGGRLLPGPVGPYGAEHGEHRRRLCQRPRDLRGPAGIRPGGEGPGGRQRAREEGRLARPARQGAVPGAGGAEARRRPGGGGERGRGRVQGPRPGGPARQPTLETPNRLRASQRPGRPFAGRGGRPADSGSHARPGRVPITSAARHCCRRRPSAARTSISASSNSGSPRPP